MIWTESATNLGALPPVGGFFCVLAPKHEGGPYSEARAFSIVGGELPRKLIESCKQKRAIDLSPTLSPRMPVTSPGSGAGQHRQAYLKIDFLYSEPLDMWHHAHLMDAMAGTHLVPPAFALPAPGTEPAYATEVRGWLADFERKYGPRGTSEMTTDKVPLSWTCGPVASSMSRPWSGRPTGPVAGIAGDHAGSSFRPRSGPHGELKPGEVVVFLHGASRPASAPAAARTPASGPIRWRERAKAGRPPDPTRSFI